ncbi:MAG: hypothetical protein KGI57_00755, partial [Hyphomicrobiales bacterium]|nr:hypothetical protein [Hyphomicrobiales bacterium]
RALARAAVDDPIAALISGGAPARPVAAPRAVAQAAPADPAVGRALVKLGFLKPTEAGRPSALDSALAKFARAQGLSTAPYARHLALVHLSRASGVAIP